MRFIEEYKGVPLVLPWEINFGDNCYTIITGKNGVGKSRLISEIAMDYTELFYKDSYGEIFRRYNGGLDIPRVIAISTSPFDKFPLNNKRLGRGQYSNYRYVGMRGFNGVGASAISLISSAMSGIFEKLISGDGIERLANVFNVLGFSPDVNFVFKLNNSVSWRNSKYNSNVTGDDRISNYFAEKNISLDSKVMDGLYELDDTVVADILNAISFVTDFNFRNEMFSVDIGFLSTGMFRVKGSYFEDNEFVKSVSILLRNNVIKVVDVKLFKHEYGQMSLRRASSGEQCMLVIMLGIAGHITDGSLILIDEPEISLHPKWQEKFTGLLIDVFSAFRNCQFIIATHSPQIVSNLSDSSCFITSITKREVYSAGKYKNQSSDFQLAELFDAPGTKNEYISRLSFALLSKIKKQKDVFDDDRSQLKHLMSFVPELRKDDAVYELIITIKEVVDFYASN